MVAMVMVVIVVMVAMVIMMIRLGMVVVLVMTGQTEQTGQTTNHSELAKFFFVFRQVLVGECFVAALVCAHVLHALNQHLCGQVQVPWALYR